MLLTARMCIRLRENIFANKIGMRAIWIDILTVGGFTESFVINTCEHMNARLDKTVSHTPSTTEEINRYDFVVVLHVIRIRL